MPKFLVTGGAGFIGSNLVDALVKEEHEVIVLDNFSTGKLSNLEASMDRIKIINGDIRDLEICYTAAEGVDFILHKAAIGSVPHSVANPIDTHENNITGTLNVLLAARDQGVKRIVLAASSSVYGDSEESSKVETIYPGPISPYAVSKLALEFYANVFYKVYGLETVCLRYFNVFGPKQDPESMYAAVIPIFISKLLRQESPEIFGDGEQTRDFTYIDNVIQANLQACFSLKQIGGKTFNIACGQQISINQLYKTITSYMGTELLPIYKSVRQGDVQHSLASIELAIRELDYNPSIDFEQGLKKSFDWYKERLVHEASY